PASRVPRTGSPVDRIKPGFACRPTRQHSIVQRLLRALRRKTAEQLVAEEPLGEATTAAPLPGVVDGSGFVGPDPPTAPLVEQAGKATWRGRSIDIGSSSAIAPSG